MFSRMSSHLIPLPFDHSDPIRQTPLFVSDMTFCQGSRLRRVGVSLHLNVHQRVLEQPRLRYGQCGGTGWKGYTICEVPARCSMGALVCRNGLHWGKLC